MVIALTFYSVTVASIFSLHGDLLRAERSYKMELLRKKKGILGTLLAATDWPNGGYNSSDDYDRLSCLS